MKEQEAVERLQCMRLFMQINDDSNDSKFLEDDYIANEMAIKALEKQIPKKINSVCISGKTISGYCPTCDGTVLIYKTFLRRAMGKHCDWCGQKLDWSE